jgi:hypothetical protein
MKIVVTASSNGSANVRAGTQYGVGGTHERSAVDTMLNFKEIEWQGVSLYLLSC